MSFCACVRLWCLCVCVCERARERERERGRESLSLSLVMHSGRSDFFLFLSLFFSFYLPYFCLLQVSISPMFELFTLLGSTSVKAVRRTFMKLSPGVNFINILSAFLFKSVSQLFAGYNLAM